jgi:alanyl-tRNA synthetase
LTREIAEENGLLVDESGFKKEMEQQKNKAREALKNKGNAAWAESLYSKLDKSIKTEFVGYESKECESTVLIIVKDNEVVENAQEGDEVTLILDTTPFYAESGGQVGDSGYLEAPNFLVSVNDCKKTADGKYLHIGLVKKGLIEKGDKLIAKIDIKRRLAIARNHTTTHLIQKALRNVLGSHVNQAGSLVEPDRLRFDFSHFSPVSSEELRKIEKEVNDKILESIPVSSREMPITEAKKLGATALFGEKYGDIVRLVKIGDYSLELCGGTHLDVTSQAGLLKILGESGVAAGVRRIEALTGEAALDYHREKEKVLEEVAVTLKTSPQESVKRIEILIADIKNAEKEIEKLRSKLVNGSADEVLSGAAIVNGIKVITARFDQLDMEALRNTSDMLKSKIGSGVVVLVSSYGDKVSFVVTATKDVIEKGIHSGNIVKEVAKIAGGGGGGRPDMAQAGGKDVSKIDEALKASLKVVESQVK